MQYARQEDDELKEHVFQVKMVLNIEEWWVLKYDEESIFVSLNNNLVSEMLCWIHEIPLYLIKPYFPRLVKPWSNYHDGKW